MVSRKIYKDSVEFARMLRKWQWKCVRANPHDWWSLFFYYHLSYTGSYTCSTRVEKLIALNDLHTFVRFSSREEVFGKEIRDRFRRLFYDVSKYIRCNSKWRWVFVLQSWNVISTIQCIALKSQKTVTDILWHCSSNHEVIKTNKVNDNDEQLPQLLWKKEEKCLSIFRRVKWCPWANEVQRFCWCNQ